jgi:hypothetical protein
MARGDYVCVFDNLSIGSMENVKHWLDNPNFTFIRGDLLSQSDLKKLEVYDYNVIFHLAANPGVRIGSIEPSIHFQQNAVATYNLLEHVRRRARMNLLKVVRSGVLPLKLQSSAYSPCLASIVESIVIDGIWSRYMSMRAKSMALTGYLRLPLPEFLYLASIRRTVQFISKHSKSVFWASRAEEPPSPRVHLLYSFRTYSTPKPYKHVHKTNQK